MAQDMALAMTAAGLTDVGRMRRRNEDCFAIAPDIGLAVVCDGMGGHAGGDVASRTATEEIIEDLRRAALRTPAPATSDAARAAVSTANRRLVAINEERGFSDGRGMGTTVVGVLRVPATGNLIGFHAGDSRLYRFRGGDLRQLTRDHSLYQMWLDAGSRGAAPHRNIITRALGSGTETTADVAVHAVADGDLFLLCSDGLFSMVPDAAIAQILETEQANGLEAACARLVAQANQAGGADNITVVLAHFHRP
jgi:protein phosphatase